MGSENGWEPARVGADACDWITVPGTNPPVKLRLLKGLPLVIMRAYAADFNAYIEPLLDPDSAAYTPTNSVATSNHLNGTAMDLNWNSHPFRVDYAGFDPPKIARMREMLAYYNMDGIQIMFWAQDWKSPKDAMHHQMGYRTFENPAVLDRFIRERIRFDGFSRYKRADVPMPPPSVGYGLPTGSRINYGAPGFPDWVYQMAQAFGLKASTYVGHQENDRNEAGFEPNPAHLNRGIDWNDGPVDKMQAFADYLLNIRTSLEQVIWQNPNTGQRVGVAGGKDVSNTGYYDSDYGGHRDHVHTRQSRPIPMPGGSPPPPPPPPAPVEDGAVVLLRVMGGTVSLDRYRELLPTFRSAVTQSNAATPKRINMFTAQLGHESSGLKYMEEIADGSAYEGRSDLGNTQPGDGKRFKGRGPIQITGRHNYTQLSQWAHSKGYVPSPTFFVDHPEQLASPTYGFLGAVWYWTVARPKINEMCDWDNLEDSLVAVTKAINGGLNGLDDRRNRLNRARSMDLAPIMRETGPPPPPPVEEDDFLSALSAEEQRGLYNAIMNQRKSRSPLRELDEGNVGDAADQIWDMDSSIHVLVVYLMAMLGHEGQLKLLERVALADPARYPDRQDDKEVAQAILAEVQDNQRLKQDILAALGRVAAAAPVPMTSVEVLPAIRQAKPVQTQSMNTPDDLLDTMDRLKVFDESYREKFDDLAKGKK